MEACPSCNRYRSYYPTFWPNLSRYAPPYPSTSQSRYAMRMVVNPGKSVIRLPDSDACPCCGAPLSPSRLVVDLDCNVIIYRDQRWRVTAQIAEFVYVLAKSWPKVVSIASMTQAIWGQHDPPASWPRTLWVYAWRVRRILADSGGSIVYTHGRGFRLVLSTQPTGGKSTIGSSGKVNSDG